MKMEKPSREKYPPVTEITDTERVEMVKEIFSSITGKYDFLNHFLSLGRDIAWRHFAVKKMTFFKTARMLDVGTGTADLAIDVALTHPTVQVTGVDFVQEMLDCSRKKIHSKGLSSRLDLLRGDALHLPFSDGSFDVAAIAFGIRNIPNMIAAIKEMIRVVVPGGQVMLLEMTFPRTGPIYRLYNVYLNRLLPWMAQTLSSNAKAYYYLGDSIINFPSPEALAGLMEGAGLQAVRRYCLTLGITYLHVGVKP